MELSIIVLAAGQGTRMKSPLPKVLHLIGGQPMLAHVIHSARALAPSQIIVVHGFGGEAVKLHFLDEDLTWVDQKQQLGTGHAVFQALDKLPRDNRALILFGDVPMISSQTLQQLVNSTPTQDVGLLTVTAQNPFGLGRIIRKNDGKVERIVEEKDANDIERQIQEVNTGIMLVPVSYLQAWLPKLQSNNQQNELYLTDIIGLAQKDGINVKTASPMSANEVLGVNDRYQQSVIERLYQKQQAETLMKQGVYISDASRFDLRGTVHADVGVSIDVNVILQGHNRLGRGASIGPNCVLIDCEIGENVKVLANSYLENAKVDSECTVGPYARLRPGTTLEAGAKVGNFVEVKNSYIGKGSKVNHLSYIGDASLGRNVNIGAGTITCNYDGANKYQTTIYDNVLVGSGTMLVAPVTIGIGATIAAGSTLVKDAPEGTLTLTHALNQRTLESWTRPQKDKKTKSSETTKAASGS